MLRVRLRPNRYLLAKNYIQVVGNDKDSRDTAIAWLLNGALNKPIKAPAKIDIPGKGSIPAVALYSQGDLTAAGCLETATPVLLGVIFGTDEIISEYLTDKDAVLEVLPVANNKNVVAVRTIQPDFGRIWIVNKPVTI